MGMTSTTIYHLLSTTLPQPSSIHMFIAFSIPRTRPPPRYLSATSPSGKNQQDHPPLQVPAVRYRLKHGRSPKGIQLKVIRWRNPDRKFTTRDWRYPDDADVKANVVEMMGASWASRHTPQQAAWVTLQNALGAVEVSNLSLG